MEENAQEQLETLVDLGSSVIRGDRGNIYILTIVGQVEGHQVLPPDTKSTKYEHVLPLLASIEESDDIDGLLLLLNTVGGDIEAGLAIAEMIASMSKPTVSLVLGGGHSIGVPLAVAAKKSFIVPSATMTIHPVRISGTVIGAPQTFTYFRDMQERIINFISRNSRAEPDTLRQLMMRPDQIATDCGSIVEGREAVEYGLIDEIGGLNAALEALEKMIKKVVSESEKGN